MSSPLPAIPAAEAWVGSWIEPVEADDGPDADRPAYHLAGEFTIALSRGAAGR